MRTRMRTRIYRRAGSKPEYVGGFLYEYVLSVHNDMQCVHEYSTIHESNLCIRIPE